jgi:hypothetical protein
MIVTYERGSGLTTRQILAAPENGVYVALDPGNLIYTRNLARSLERGDLKLVVPSWLARNWRGLTSPVTVDHAFSIDRVSARDRMEWHRAIVSLHDRGLIMPVVSSDPSQDPIPPHESGTPT